MLCLFQENKSHGGKTSALILCLHVTAYHVPNNLFSLHADHWTSQGRVEPIERDKTESGRTNQVKIILIKVVLEVTRNTVGESRFSGDGQNCIAAHKDMPGHRTR
jgi:hypothetical protein